MKTIDEKYFELVNIDEDTTEITVLDSLFEYEDGMRGATGSKFEPITEDQIQDSISDYEDDDMELLCYFADSFGEVTRQMIEGVDSSREALIELMFDLSYSEKWDNLREMCGMAEEEAVIFNCIGGGRCFNADFQGNKDPKNLSKKIREFESK